MFLLVSYPEQLKPAVVFVESVLHKIISGGFDNIVFKSWEILYSQIFFPSAGEYVAFQNYKHPYNL